MPKKKELVEVSIEVEEELYTAVKETLRALALSPEYAAGQFVRMVCRRKKVLIDRYNKGADAESLIGEMAEEAIKEMVRTTMQHRKILQEMSLARKEVSITDLRLHWGQYMKWIEEPGRECVITRKGKPEAVMVSARTWLAMTSYSTDDKIIRDRCEMLELM